MARVLAVFLWGSAFLVFSIAISTRIVFGRVGRRPSLDPARSALATLNERFARGEIDRDEYLERRSFID